MVILLVFPSSFAFIIMENFQPNGLQNFKKFVVLGLFPSQGNFVVLDPLAFSLKRRTILFCKFSDLGLY